MLSAWYIYLHLPPKLPKLCRYIGHFWASGIYKVLFFWCLFVYSHCLTSFPLWTLLPKLTPILLLLSFLLLLLVTSTSTSTSSTITTACSARTRITATAAATTTTTTGFSSILLPFTKSNRYLAHCTANIYVNQHFPPWKRHPISLSKELVFPGEHSSFRIMGSQCTGLEIQFRPLRSKNKKDPHPFFFRRVTRDS